MQVGFVKSIRERLFGAKCFTFSEIVYEFCQWYQILSPPQCMVIVDIMSLNKHMGLLSLEVD